MLYRFDIHLDDSAPSTCTVVSLDFPSWYLLIRRGGFVDPQRLDLDRSKAADLMTKMIPTLATDDAIQVVHAETEDDLRDKMQAFEEC